MREKEKKIYSVVQFPLIVDKETEIILNKKLKCACNIYNNMVRREITKYQEMIKTRAYRENQAVIMQEYQKADEEGKKKTTKSPALKEALEKRNVFLQEYGFREFDFRAEAIRASKPYEKNISSTVASVSIGDPLWAAFSKLLYGNGERVRYKKLSDCNRLESDNRSGIRLLRNEKGQYYLFFSNRNARAKELKVYLKCKKTDYDMEMLNREIKRVALIRKKINGRYRFYCHLIVSGAPYIKVDENGERIHPINTGLVGLSIYRNQLCAVSEHSLKIWDLCPGLENYICQRTEIDRKLTELRKALNPDNYNEDGTIKKGIMEDGKRKKLTWTVNGTYKRLKDQKSKLEWKERVNREILKNKIVYELLEMGDHFVIYDNSFLTKKPEFDPENPLKNSEYRKKKDRRRSIQEAAPAELITKINNKLAFEKLDPVKKVKLPEELYWYHHEKGKSDKSFFDGDMVSVCGSRIPHTLYRAYLIRYFDEEHGCYSHTDCEEGFLNFLNNLNNVCTS